MGRAITVRAQQFNSNPMDKLLAGDWGSMHRSLASDDKSQSLNALEDLMRSLSILQLVDCQDLEGRVGDGEIQLHEVSLAINGRYTSRVLRIKKYHWRFSARKYGHGGRGRIAAQQRGTYTEHVFRCYD
ncbi:hypothetical protein Fot_07159 [Forsythia ovata]|uniref:Uncharacterized protein n=1 Tax=Forsythia ovata TaxID=205694 RepID=A0ABD1WVQ1_9LAMI